MQKPTNEELKIICPYCNKPYTGEMKESLSSSMGCPTCGPDAPTGSIEIICTNCGKVVYKKEI